MLPWPSLTPDSIQMVHCTTIVSPEQLSKTLPLSDRGQKLILEEREAVNAILDGKDPRMLLIVGPCSVHDVDETLEYAANLLSLYEAVRKHLFIVMRVYFEKSRTGLGWKGLLHDPLLDNSCKAEQGLYRTRELLLKLTAMGISTAAELLDPICVPYYQDLLSWGCIGARTCSSQTHRQLSSGVPFAIGIKNSIDGNIDTAIQSVSVAQSPQTFFAIDGKGQACLAKSQGNPFAHIILRGSETGPNSDLASIEYTISQLAKAGLQQRLLLDCSHGNSMRQAARQPEQLMLAAHYREKGVEAVRGALLESNLQPGKQRLQNSAHLQRGVSLTDECIGWQETESLLLALFAKLEKAQYSLVLPS